MPLRGGSSAKAGIRYEDVWTALQALEVLRESASSIRIEPPGAEGDGIEFWLERGDLTEFHQVKRQRSRGSWTVAALKDEGVFDTFERKLRDPSARCVFVSTESARSLKELAENARAAESVDDFAAFLESAQRQTTYLELCRVWPRHDERAVLDLLRRITFRAVEEDQLWAQLGIEAETLMDGEPAHQPDMLIGILRRALNETLRPDDVWRLLMAHGIRPSPWRDTRELGRQMVAVNQDYVAGRKESLIGRKLITRPETARLMEAMTGATLVVVEGDAGTGKSDVLLELVLELERKATPYLAFRLDRVPPVVRPHQLAEPLGLRLSTN